MTTMSTNEDLERIKRRVAKLRKMAERGSTEEERDTALKLAQQLMEKHAVTEWMMREASPDNLVFPVVHYISFGKNAPYIKARRSLLASICVDNRVELFMMKGRDRLCMVGFKSDIDYSLELYASLELHMEAMMGRAEVSNTGNASRFRTNFAYGYAGRIDARLREWKTMREMEAASDTAGTALVLRDRGALVKDKVREAFGTAKTRKGPAARHGYDGAAYAAGAQAANQADLSGGRKGIDSK